MCRCIEITQVYADVLIKCVSSESKIDVLTEEFSVNGTLLN